MTDIKQLLKEFTSFGHGQSLHSAFVDLLDWSLLPFKKFDTQPEQLQAFEEYRNHPKVIQLVSLLQLIGEASEDFCDPLGELFMQAISNGHNGQYFTPEPICGMLSLMSGDTLENGQKILDPACGSGRMLLAAAKRNRHVRLYGADLDSVCCKMALFNLLLNSLTGEVAHLNSLTNEFYRGYKVNTTLVGDHYIPYYIEFTEPELSEIWLHPLKVNEGIIAFTEPFTPMVFSTPMNGIQGSLF